MSEWTWKRVVSIGIGVVALLWILGPIVIWGLGQVINDPNGVADYGAVGDMFGASTSLFSGLGLLGVAIVLYYDMRERRRDLVDRQEARRPLLLPEIPDRGVILSRAATVGKFPEITLTVDFTVANATDEPALNIELEAHSEKGSPDLDIVVDLDGTPIAGRDSGAAQIRCSAAGPAAQAFLSRTSGEDLVVLTVQISYDNINGVRWRSVVRYEIASRPADRDTLAKIRDHDPDVTVGTPDTPLSGGLAFTAKPVRNSWHQSRMPSPPST